MMVKLPCGFCGVREALPYIPTKVISVMGQKCITCSSQHQELQFCQVPKEMHKGRLLLATTTHSP